MSADQNKAMVDRRSGVAVWRQIADSIRSGITEGEFTAGGRLPGENTLAARFGVNRHTVRAAIAALEHEGVVRAMPGRGTEILPQKRLVLPVSRRTRFSAGLDQQGRKAQSTFLSSAVATSSAVIAERLGLLPDSLCVMVETLGLADGVPVSLAQHYFPEERFSGIDKAIRETQSVTRAFAALGLADYIRIETEIAGRHADEGERHWLKLAPGAIVLEAIALNGDLEGRPVQYSRTRFAADRVSLRMEAG